LAGQQDFHLVTSHQLAGLRDLSSSESHQYANFHYQPVAKWLDFKLQKRNINTSLPTSHQAEVLYSRGKLKSQNYVELLINPHHQSVRSGRGHAHLDILTSA
jgi:hypothetical protein